MPLNGNLLLTPADNERQVVAADLEGTLTAGATWSGMRRWLEAHGEGARFKQFLRQRMFKVIRFRLGLIRDVRAFKEQWVLDLYQLFAGYSKSDMDEIGAYVVEHELWPQRRQAVIDEFLGHQADGCRALVVTGVNEPVLGQFVARLEGVEAIGTPFEYEEDQFTGNIMGIFNTGQSKVDQLQPFAQDGRIRAAYGDTAADIPMLEMAAEAVAVFPDKGLAQAAQQQRWRVIS